MGLLGTNQAATNLHTTTTCCTETRRIRLLSSHSGRLNSKSTNLKEDNKSKAHGQDQPELSGERVVVVAAIVSVAANTHQVR